MKYLLDTDHLSILQRQSGAEYGRLAAWVGQFPSSEFACSVVSLHEQFLGAHNYLNQAKNATGLVRGYKLLERLPSDYLSFALLPFDGPASGHWDRFVAKNLRIGAMALRLAAIALAQGLTVLTRNLRDFNRVPGLHAEDRTV